MKTNRLVLLCVATTMFLLASCGKKKCDCDDCPTYLNGTKPKQTITYEYAKNLEKEFVNTRANTLNKILDQEKIIKGEDVRDVWFDIETMKQYIAYVEAESKKKGYKSLGLRVYYGAYPNKSTFPDPGYATVFFIPTHKSKIMKSNFVYQDPNENSEDIDGLNMGHGGHPPTGL